MLKGLDLSKFYDFTISKGCGFFNLTLDFNQLENHLKGSKHLHNTSSSIENYTRKTRFDIFNQKYTKPGKFMM